MVADDLSQLPELTELAQLAEENQVKKKKNKEKLWTKNFLLIFAANFFLFMSLHLLITPFPFFIKSIGGSASLVGVVMCFFSFGSVVSRPFAGWLLDMQDRKSIFFIGAVLVGLAIFSYSLAGTVVLVILLRLLHGFGWGATSTATSTNATDIVPKTRFGEGIGYFGITINMAMVIGPALGLWISSKYGFPPLFYTSCVMLAIAVLLTTCFKSKPIPPRDKTQKFNFKTNLINKHAIPPAILGLFTAMIYGAMSSFIAVYCDEIGLTTAGLFFSCYAMALLIIRPLAGGFADAKGEGLVVVLGQVALFVGLLIFASSHSNVTLLISGCFMGVAFGLLIPSLQSMSVRGVPIASRGAANSTYLSAYDLGIGLGVLLGGFLADLFNYRTMYYCLLIPIVIAFCLYWFWVRKINRTQKTVL